MRCDQALIRAGADYTLPVAGTGQAWPELALLGQVDLQPLQLRVSLQLQQGFSIGSAAVRQSPA